MSSYHISTRLAAISCFIGLTIGYSSSLSIFLDKHLPLQEILYNNYYISRPYLTYQDLFPSEYETQSSITGESEFEADLPEVEDMSDQSVYKNTPLQNTPSYKIVPHTPIIIPIEKADVKPYYDTRAITLNIPQKINNTKQLRHQKPTTPHIPVNLQAITLKLPKNTDISHDNIVQEVSYVHQASYFNFNTAKTDNDNIYTLPISDAIHIQSGYYQQKKNNLTQDIANIYQKRRKQTLGVRNTYHIATQDIHSLQRILKILGISLEKKFYASKHNTVVPSSLLKTIQISQDEMIWRYPELYTRLSDIHALRIALTFIPTHLPVKTGRRSSGFGWRQDPFTKRSKFHSGMDYAAPLGTPVYTTASGTVRFAGRKGGYGNVIDIYHGNGIVTRYAHLSKILVTTGSKVMRGAVIGSMGSTGRSTGSHLHYEIKLSGKTINPNNFIIQNNAINKIINKY